MGNLHGIIQEVRKVIAGKDRVLWMVLTAMLARGHILLEDIPGVGKTTMALAFSKALGLDYGRVQFTPDVMPSDVTGFSMLSKESGRMVYQKGAVLCNLFLADELNRATSRTQSALLEAMEEGQVTVDGQSHRLSDPFIVIATQNPVGASGTQMLPDSQLDRFAVRLTIGYPSPKYERAMLLSAQNSESIDSVREVMNRQEFVEARKKAAEVYISDDVADYIISLISATRSDALFLRGASPRATLSLADMARAMAFVNDRDYVLPADIQTVFADTLSHRMLLSDEAEANGIDAQEACSRILRKVKAPKVN